MKKKIYNEKKKNCCAEPFLGYCPKYIVKIFFFVLQALQLYFKREGWKKKIVVKIVLQYHFCIAGGVRLYCSIRRKIVL